MSDPRLPAPLEDEERVPLFGTWARIYTAVIASAVLMMALIALFSRWPW